MRPYPGYNSLTMNENSGNAHYNSLQVTLAKRLSHGLSFAAAYTLAKTAGNLENQGLFSQNWQKYTGYVLSNDREHVFNISYTYDMPKALARPALSTTDSASACSTTGDLRAYSRPSAARPTRPPSASSSPSPPPA